MGITCLIIMGNAGFVSSTVLSDNSDYHCYACCYLVGVSADAFITTTSILPPGIYEYEC